MAQATHLIRIECPSEESTERVGEIIAEVAPRPTCVTLEGELGAGKTRLARGLARGRAGPGPGRALEIQKGPFDNQLVFR